MTNNRRNRLARTMTMAGDVLWMRTEQEKTYYEAETNEA